mmetsp:Transcript_60545/g.184965  ORF Transcript_60545/g.184965 Transcript_60545/m.184965 type:complete len:639 (+) Transcript_60545:324-2240(+)
MGVLRLQLVGQLQVRALLGLERLDVLFVLLGRIAQNVLQVAQALLHRGVVRVPGLLALLKYFAHLSLVRLRVARELGVGGLQSVYLLAVLLGAVAVRRLELLQLVLDGGLVRVGLALVVVVLPAQVRHRGAVLLARRQPRVHVVHPRFGLLEGPGVLFRGVVKDGLQVVDPLLQRRVRALERRLLRRQARVRPPDLADGVARPLASRHASRHLVDLCVGGCHLLRVRVGGVPDHPLEELEAVVDRGVLRLDGLHTLHLLGVLGVRDLQALDFLGMLVGRVAEHPLQEIDPLLQAGVVRVERRLLPGQVGVALVEVGDRGAGPLAGAQPAVDVLDLDVHGLQLLAVLVGVLVQRALEGVHAVLQGDAVRLEGRLVRGQGGVRLLQLAQGGRGRLARRQPAVELVDLAVRASDILVVATVKLPDLPLQDVHPLRHRRVVGLAGLHGLDVLRVLGVLRVELGVGRLQGLQLGGVLVGGVAEGGLEVVEALGHGGVMRVLRRGIDGQAGVRLLQVGQLGRVLLARADAAVQLLELRVRRGQLATVVVLGRLHGLLECLQALLRLLRELRVVAGKVAVQLIHLRLGARDVLLVLGRRILQGALEELHAIDQRREVRGRLLHGTMRHVQLAPGSLWLHGAPQRG